MMKKLNMKISVLSFLSVIMLTFAVLFFMNPTEIKRTSADDSANPTKVFEMLNTSSVRLDEDYNGIRFKVKMSQENYNNITENENVVLGFLVFPHEFLTEEITEDYINAPFDKINQEVLNESKIKLNSEDGFYYASVALVDILPENYDLEYTAIAYIKTEGETDQYVYADFDREFSRSVNYVAEREIITGGKIEQVQAAYPHIGAEEGTEYAHPVSINGVEDYALIAENVESGITYENVNFIIQNDFELPQGFKAIGADFAGKIDGNQKTVSTNTDGTPVFFTADEDKVVDLIFNAMATTVLSIKDESVLSRVISVKDKIKYETEGKVSFLAADSEELTALEGNYNGNALKFVLPSGANSYLNLSFAGNIPENADYVSFWFASAADWTGDELPYKHPTTGVESSSVGVTTLLNMDCGTLLYTPLAATATGTTTKIIGQPGDALNFAANTINGKGKWVHFYCPIDVFKSDMELYGGLNFVTYTSDAGKGIPIYFGDISFVENTWDGAVDTVFPAYEKEYRKHTNVIGMETVEFVNLDKLPAVVSNEQMVTDGFVMNSYTGNAYKVQAAHNGWAVDVTLDVTDIDVEDLKAKKEAGVITHLQVSFAWSSNGALEVWKTKILNTGAQKTDILPLVAPSDINGSDANSINVQNVKQKEWQTYDILIDDFITAVENAQAQTDVAYKNKVFLLTCKAGSTVDTDIYLGDMIYVKK